MPPVFGGPVYPPPPSRSGPRTNTATEPPARKFRRPNMVAALWMADGLKIHFAVAPTIYFAFEARRVTSAGRPDLASQASVQASDF